MIVLPSYPPRRAWLRSFGIWTGIFFGILLSILLPSLGRGSWSLVSGLSAAALIVVFALCIPRLFAWPYRIWNRVAYATARLAQRWILRVFHLVMIASVEMSGTARKQLEVVHPEGNSFWKSRNSAQPKRILMNPPGKHRFLALVKLWRSMGELWMVRTLPFLWFLSLVQTPEVSQENRENIYTLF